ncbi:MAG TPA: class I SAM-dependent methyltransferase [Terriglobales bacterium]|nr:class I SAM-dependent methyltransferase [Terriglobales bacterium]
MNVKAMPLSERELRRSYRIRVTVFALCALVTLVVLGALYDAIQTLGRLEAVERERDQWQRPTDVIRELNLKEGNVVVDLGSGVGYFALKLSPVVGKSGKVLPVDILKFPLSVLRTRALINGQHNIDVVLGEPDDPHLPNGSVDAVLIANTYHELTDPKVILDHVFQSLKPGGRLVILDRGPRSENGESRSDEAEHHHIPPALVEAEIRGSGFQIVKREDLFIDQPGDDQLWWLIVARKPELVSK